MGFISYRNVNIHNYLFLHSIFFSFITMLAIWNHHITDLFCLSHIGLAYSPKHCSKISIICSVFSSGTGFVLHIQSDKLRVAMLSSLSRPMP